MALVVLWILSWGRSWQHQSESCTSVQRSERRPSDASPDHWELQVHPVLHSEHSTIWLFGVDYLPPLFRASISLPRDCNGRAAGRMPSQHLGGKACSVSGPVLTLASCPSTSGSAPPAYCGTPENRMVTRTRAAACSLLGAPEIRARELYLGSTQQQNSPQQLEQPWALHRHSAGQDIRIIFLH